MADTAAREGLVARGALDGHKDRLAAIGGGISVEVLPLAQHLNLRVDARSGAADAVAGVLGVALPGPLSFADSPAGPTVVWLGPDEWLVIDPARSAELEGDLRAALAGAGAVVDQSGQRLSVVVRGDAAALLAKGTSLDLCPERFGEGSALQGFLAQAIVAFLSRPAGVELLVRTSFARYVADWILDAAHDPLAYPASHAAAEQERG